MSQSELPPLEEDIHQSYTMPWRRLARLLWSLQLSPSTTSMPMSLTLPLLHQTYTLREHLSLSFFCLESESMLLSPSIDLHALLCNCLEMPFLSPSVLWELVKYHHRREHTHCQPYLSPLKPTSMPTVSSWANKLTITILSWDPKILPQQLSNVFLSLLASVSPSLFWSYPLTPIVSGAFYLELPNVFFLPTEVTITKLTWALRFPHYSSCLSN